MEAVCGIAVIVGFFVFGLSLVGLVFYGGGEWMEETGGYQFCLDAPVVPLEYGVRMVSDVRGMRDMRCLFCISAFFCIKST